MLLKDAGTKSHGRDQSLSLMATSTPWLTAGDSVWLPVLSQQHYMLLSGTGGPCVWGIPLLTYSSRPQPLGKAVGHMWLLRDLGSVLEGAPPEGENTSEELEGLSALYPTRSDSWAQEEDTQHRWAKCSTGTVQNSVQATFFRVPGQNRHLSQWRFLRSSQPPVQRAQPLSQRPSSL